MGPAGPRGTGILGFNPAGAASPIPVLAEADGILMQFILKGSHVRAWMSCQHWGPTL